MHERRKQLIKTGQSKFSENQDSKKVIERKIKELLGRPISDGEEIDCRTFLDDINFWTGKLPESSHVINLCTDRYLFTVAFSAVIQRGQCNLLLAGHQPEFIAEAL